MLQMPKVMSNKDAALRRLAFARISAKLSWRGVQLGAKRIRGVVGLSGAWPRPQSCTGSVSDAELVSAGESAEYACVIQTTSHAKFVQGQTPADGAALRNTKSSCFKQFVEFFRGA